MVTPDRYVKLKKNLKNGFLILSYYFLLLAIEVGRKRKFVHKAEVESLAAASYKDSNSLSKKKMPTIKAGKSGKFGSCVLCAPFVATRSIRFTALKQTFTNVYFYEVVLRLTKQSPIGKQNL